MLNPPRIGRVIDHQLIGELKPTWREVVQIAKTINRDEGLVVLAKMNLLLGVAAIKEDLSGSDDIQWRVQERLIADTVSQRRLNQLKLVMGHANLRYNVIFHRAQMLAAIKIVALFGDPTKGNRLQSRQDFEVITELALGINSLLDFGDTPEGAAENAKHLAPQLAPARELAHVPRIDSAMARADRMLGSLLHARRADPLAAELERLFVFLSNGFNFERFQAVMFGVFAYFQTLRFQNLGEFQAGAFLNPYAPGNIIMGPLLEQFLAQLSLDFHDVAGEMPAIEDDRTLFFDTTFFRERPVWRFSPERYLCVDLPFVVDKLTSGFFWAVHQALDVDASDETKDRTLAFSRLWGHLFEDYCHEVLEHAYPVGSDRLIKNAFFRPGAEAFDAIVLEGANAVVMQIKGTFVKRDLKYSGRAQPFFEGLTKNFGNVPKGAVYQLATGIRDVFCLPRRSGLMGPVSVREIRTIWPVVVFLDPIMGFGLSSKLMIDEFEREAEGWSPQAYTSIRPPVFLEIEDLEVLMPHIRRGDFTLVECLREKLGDDRAHLHSFSHFYWQQFVPARKLEFKRNEMLEAVYGRLRDRNLERFSDGTFTRCKSTPFGAVYPRHGMSYGG